jgi:hypothetical protein
VGPTRNVNGISFIPGEGLVRATIGDLMLSWPLLLNDAALQREACTVALNSLTTQQWADSVDTDQSIWDQLLRLVEPSRIPRCPPQPAMQTN